MIGVIVFLGTGQYMRLVHDQLRGIPDAQRMLFRSTHIYLLLVSLINVSLGLYFTPPPGNWRRRLASLGSVLLLVAPWLLLLGFATEPWLSELARPYTRPALFSALGGIVLHLLAATGQRTNTARD